MDVQVDSQGLRHAKRVARLRVRSLKSKAARARRERAASLCLKSGTRVNLKRMFPVSYRYPLRECCGNLGWCLLLCGGMGYLAGYDGLMHPSTLLEELGVLLCLAFLAVLACKFLFQVAQLSALQYETDGFRLLITRGVVFKQEVSLPLLPITEMYVDRDFFDLLLGLYDLNIATPVTGSRAFGLIKGLTRSSARGIEEFLSGQLNRQIFTVDNPPTS